MVTLLEIKAHRTTCAIAIHPKEAPLASELSQDPRRDSKVRTEKEGSRKRGYLRKERRAQVREQQGEI